MKKYYLALTIGFALAACGGGGGGSGGSAPVRAAVTDAAVASNSAVTSMASEVLVAKDGSGTTITRSGSAVYNGQTYNSYRLGEDVKFRVAAGALSEDAYIKFHMDGNGRIDSLKMNLDGKEQDMARKADANNPSADFRGIVYEYVVTDAAPGTTGDALVQAKDKGTLVRLVYGPDTDIVNYSVLANAAAGKCPSGKVCRWDRIDQALRIVSKGKSENESERMKYSDFGIVQSANFGKYKGITSNDELAESKLHQRTTSGGAMDTSNYITWDSLPGGVFDGDFEVFAGGYDALTKRPTETMNFTGKAIGSLYASDSEHHPDLGIVLEDDNATLNFDTDTGKETLVMDFTDNDVPWYRVTVTKDNANGTNQIEFDNYANTTSDHVMYETKNELGEDILADTGTSTADYLKFHGDTGSGLTVDDFTTTHGALVEHTEGTTTEGLLNMGYYGVNTTEEAAGVVRFKETYQTAGDVQYEHEFRAGYGMKPVTE